MKQNPVATKPRRLSFDFGLLLAGQALNQALLALAGLLVVRFLAPIEYSRYTLAVAGLNLGAIVADAGLSAYVGREAARLDEFQAGQLWRNGLRLRAMLCLLVWLVTILLTALFPASGEPGLALIASLALFPSGAAALTTAFLNARGFIPAGVGLNVLNTLANFGLTLTALWWLPEAAPLLAANVVAALVAASLLGQRAYRTTNLPSLTQISADPTPDSAKDIPNLKKAGLLKKIGRMKLAPTNNNNADSSRPGFSNFDLLKASSGFMLVGLAAVLFQYADIYLVSSLLSRAEVGQYGAALRLLAIVTAVPTVWGIAALPRYARRWLDTQNQIQVISELRRWGTLLTGAGLIVAGAGLFLSGPMVALLLGPKYENAAGPLALLLWSGAGIFASAAPVTFLTITNRQHFIALALFLADSFGLTLAALLIGPLGWGLTGAAIARVATAWLLCGLYLWFGRK